MDGLPKRLSITKDFTYETITELYKWPSSHTTTWNQVVVSPIQTLLADYCPDASLATHACDPLESSTETVCVVELGGKRLRIVSMLW